MKKCKYCLSEIEEGTLTCPACGMDLEPAPAETEQEEQEAVKAPARKPAKKKANPVKIAVAIALIVVLLAVLAALIFVGMNTVSKNETSEEASVETVEETVAATVPADGEPGTAMEKGTYTASDDEVIDNKKTVVAKIGSKTLTNSQLQVYYWMGYHNFMTTNYAYAQYFGLDMSQPLDTQIMNPALHGQDASMTWQQYFLQFALDSWQQVQAVAIEAEENGMEMAEEDQESLKDLESTLEEAIKEYDVSLEEYLLMNFGPGADLEDYAHYQEVYYQGAPYYADEINNLEPTDEELEAYFTEHADEYASGGVTKETRHVDVRHILLQPENPKEDGTYADEDWAACETAAQALLDEFLAGDKTEEAFGELAGEHTTDPGSKDTGGLYEDVFEGQMVPTFNDWCFDETRQHGDTGLVKTDYGYHVMYFVEAREEVWKDYAKSDWITEQSNTLLQAVLEKHPMEVYYDKINIGLLMERN